MSKANGKANKQAKGGGGASGGGGKSGKKGVASLKLGAVKSVSDDLNLTTLRQSDAAIERILHTVSHVVVYHLPANASAVPQSAALTSEPTSGDWERKGIEGPLFIVRRLEGGQRTSIRMIVLNRQSIQNLVIPLSAVTAVEQHSQFLFYHTRTPSGITETAGLWFFELSECQSTHNILRDCMPPDAGHDEPIASQSYHSASAAAAAPVLPAPLTMSVSLGSAAGILTASELERTLSFGSSPAQSYPQPQPSQPPRTVAPAPPATPKLLGPGAFGGKKSPLPTIAVKAEPASAKLETSSEEDSDDSSEGAPSPVAEAKAAAQPWKGVAHGHAAHAHAPHAHHHVAWAHGHGHGHGHGHEHAAAHSHSAYDWLSKGEFMTYLAGWAAADPAFVDALYRRYVAQIIRHNKYHVAAPSPAAPTASAAGSSGGSASAPPHPKQHHALHPHTTPHSSLIGRHASAQHFFHTPTTPSAAAPAAAAAAVGGWWPEYGTPTAAAHRRAMGNASAQHFHAL